MHAIERVCTAVGVVPPSAWEAYFDAAKGWGARTDLTGARTDGELAEILFLDAAVLIRDGWVEPGVNLVDVGAGVGAPTIPLLLAVSDCRAKLIEPRRKRTAFLRSAIGALGLADRAQTLEMKIDPSAPTVPGAPFDIALSRATFAAEEWRETGLELAREVWVFAADVPHRCAIPEPIRQVTYEVPSSGAPRSILAYGESR